jgi:hypothetical protein
MYSVRLGFFVTDPLPTMVIVRVWVVGACRAKILGLGGLAVSLAAEVVPVVVANIAAGMNRSVPRKRASLAG